MTREETSKIRKTYNQSGKCQDIEILRNETGQRILHKRRLLYQSIWARSTFANFSYSSSNFDSDRQIRVRVRVREGHMEHTHHRTTCAMIVFHATGVWHMPHVFVWVGRGVGCAHVMIYMYNAAHTLASFVSFRANGLWHARMHARRMLWLMAHGQAFCQATDARSGARCLPAASLRATRTCATAASFASCSHRVLLKTWQTQRANYETVSEFVVGWKDYKSVLHITGTHAGNTAATTTNLELFVRLFCLPRRVCAYCFAAKLTG